MAEGSALEEYERSLTIWDSSRRYARWQRTYFDAVTFGVTAKRYDIVGNVIVVIKPVQFEGSGPATTYTYDSRKLFAIGTKNELGHAVVTSYDYGTGAALRTIGPNVHSCGASCGGNVRVEETRTDIDGLGRPIATWVSRDASPGYQLVKVARTTYVDVPAGSTPTSVTTEELIEYGADRWTFERELFDGHGRPIESLEVSEVGQARTTYDYASDGTLVSVTLPSPESNGAFVTYSYTYDSIGRPTSIRRPDGTALTGSGIDLTYAGVTHTRTEVAGAGGGPEAVTELVHDSFGRLSVVREQLDDAAYASTFYQYDPRNVVTQIDDPEDVTTMLVHDWAGRRTRITRGTRTWSYGYDKNGNLAFETSPLPALNPPPPTLALDYTTTYSYDDLDRISTKLAAPRDISGPDRVLLGIGQTVYQYDATSDGANRTGRLSSVSLPADSTGTPILRTTYDYDAEGNVTAERRSGRFGGIAESRRILTTYGPAGRTVSVDHGDGALPDDVATRSRFGYDGRGEPIRAFLGLSGAAPTAQLAVYTRNLAGLIVARVRPTGTHTQRAIWTYDKLGRVVRQDVKVGSQPRALQTLTYWGSDDPRTLSHSGIGLTDRAYAFAYDRRHQLTGVTTSPSTFTASYAFRPSGRLHAANVQYPAPSAGSDVRPRAVTYKYEARDPEMLSKLETADQSAFATYAYDAAGNIETRVQEGAATAFLYDGDDHLRRSLSSGGREDYYYDHAGTRVAIVKRSADGTPQELRYFQSSLETWRDASGALTRTLAHVNLGTPIARIENRTTLDVQYHSTLQSLLVSLNAGGTVNTAFAYGPYGEILEASGTQLATHRRRYNDKHKDELTGLSYYGYRYYDPVAQIWTSSDPLYRFTPDAAWDQPRRALLYAFDVGNPMRYVDVDGLGPKDKFQKVMGGISNFLGSDTAVGITSGLALAAAKLKNPYALAAAGAIRGTREVAGALSIGVLSKIGLVNLMSGGDGNESNSDALGSPAGPGGGGGRAPGDGLDRATAARDAKLAEIRSGSGKQRNKVSTVVGAHDPATGNVAVGVKTAGCDHGKCAEDLAAEALGNPDPKTIEFTPVIRPRNDVEVPRCEGCSETYGKE